MYRAVSLAADDRDLHRFVWRENPEEPLRQFRMTIVTFSVSTSSFEANMALKQNAIDHACSQSRNDIVAHSIYSDWLQNFSYLSKKQIPRCYFDKCSGIISIQLHGFCDASEKAYAGVVYIRSIGNVKGSLVAAAKSKVAPIKKMTIPQNVSCVELIYLLS